MSVEIRDTIKRVLQKCEQGLYPREILDSEQLSFFERDNVRIVMQEMTENGELVLDSEWRLQLNTPEFIIYIGENSKEKIVDFDPDLPHGHTTNQEAALFRNLRYDYKRELYCDEDGCPARDKFGQPL